MGNFYAYHRTSTTDQHLDRGIKEISEYCSHNHIPLSKIYTDQKTGRNFNRPRYQVLKEDILRPGDTLIVTELDRLGRNKKSTMKELEYYRDNDIRVMILELPTTCQDFSALGNDMARMLMETINNMLIELYAAMAESELNKKQKRQVEGIEAKKARGEWEDYGRPRTLSIDSFKNEYQRVVSGKIKPFQLMKELGLSKSTYYRYVKELKQNYINLKDIHKTLG